MRRLAVLTLSVLVTGIAPVDGRVVKPIEESYTATALPYPNGSYDSGEGCFQGVDTVHRHHHPFEAPSKGTIEVAIPVLTGDWDLFLLDEAGEVLTESSGSSGEPEFAAIRLKKGQAISIMTCNWAGEPQVTVEYSFR